MELLQFLFVSSLLIPARAISRLERSRLYSNCSLLALDALGSGRGDAPVNLIWNSHVKDVVTFTVSRSDRTFILSNQPLQMYRRAFPVAYLLHSKNLAAFECLHSKLSSMHMHWYPRSVFIVCIRDANISALQTVAARLYSINAYNFVILAPNQNRTAIDVYKWHPFAETSQCGAVFDLRHINVCDGSKMMLPTTALFSMEWSPTFPAGCIMNAAAFHWPPYTYASPPDTNNFDDGLNVQTMAALTRMYGIRVNYTRVDDRGRWGALLRNGTWTGILGVLQRGEVDVALGQILQTPPRFRYFESSYTCPLFMKFYLALPDKFSHWMSMIRIFSFTFWRAISAVYVVTSVFICLASRLSERPSKSELYNSYGACFLNLWCVALSIPASVPSSKTARLVFLSWLVYSFHITLIYSSALLGVITTPMVEQPSIRTLKEFSDSDYKLLVVPQFIQITALMDDGIRTMIKQKYGELKITNAQEIEQMIQRKDFAIADPHDHFEIVAREKLEYIYSLDDFVRLNQGIYLTKGNIFLKYVDNIQRLVMENGLFEKWRRDLVGSYKYKKHRTISYRNKVLPLTMDELSGSFYLLLSGLAMSGVVFCMELGYNYLNRKY